MQTKVWLGMGVRHPKGIVMLKGFDLFEEPRSGWKNPLREAITEPKMRELRAIGEKLTVNETYVISEAEGFVTYILRTHD